MAAGTRPARPPEPPEEFSASEKYMTLLEHVGELRVRLMICAGFMVVATAISFYFAKDIMEYLLNPAEKAQPGFKPIQTEPLEFIASYFKISLLCALAISMPMIVYQLIAFVSPGLTPQEKKWIIPIVLGSGLSFVAGLAFGFYVALPPAIDFLINFGEDVAEPTLRIGPYIDFVLRMLLISGITFQTPLLIMGLAKLRIVHGQWLVRQWRYVVVGAFIVSAIVTPTIDPITQTLIAAPIIVLYGFGTILAFLVQPGGDQPVRFS
ncbi:MAG TPA: twin-arginine translocase subunit TatC [Dehalococcoidia bacterium]|nr:twin-arginine translocase subunit TatC [Dehalococcoidia bacterium]